MVPAIFIRSSFLWVAQRHTSVNLYLAYSEIFISNVFYLVRKIIGFRVGVLVIPASGMRTHDAIEGNDFTMFPLPIKTNLSLTVCITSHAFRRGPRPPIVSHMTTCARAHSPAEYQLTIPHVKRPIITVAFG